MEALTCKNEQVALTLIEHGADVTSSNNNNETALHYAAQQGLNKAALALIKRSANIDAQNKDGDTPLMLALLEGEEQLALTLIEKGADVTSSNSNNNETALHYAAQQGFNSTVQALIKKGANINAKGEYGNTPLIMALLSGKEQVALTLIEHGEDIAAYVDELLTSTHTPYLFAMLSEQGLQNTLEWANMSTLKLEFWAYTLNAQLKAVDYLRLRGADDLALMYQTAIVRNTLAVTQGELSPLTALWEALLKEKSLDDSEENITFVLKLLANATPKARNIALPIILAHLKNNQEAKATHESDEPSTSDTPAASTDTSKQTPTKVLITLIAKHLEEHPFLANELIGYVALNEGYEALSSLLLASEQDATRYPEKYISTLSSISNILFTDNEQMPIPEEYRDQNINVRAYSLQKAIECSLEIINFSLTGLSQKAQKNIKIEIAHQKAFLQQLLITALSEAHDIIVGDACQNPWHLIAIHCPDVFDHYKFDINYGDTASLQQALAQIDAYGHTPLYYAEESGNSKLVEKYNTLLDNNADEKADTDANVNSIVDEVLTKTSSAITHSASTKEETETGVTADELTRSTATKNKFTITKPNQ